MKHCLIIDDSQIIRKVARRILEAIDFEIEEAEDSNTAVEICRAKMPEAILLDWNMPNMSGLEFLRNLRREKDGAKPVVLFCTSENDVGHITEAINAGADEYIMKPFDRDVLVAKFKDVGLA